MRRPKYGEEKNHSIRCATKYQHEINKNIRLSISMIFEFILCEILILTKPLRNSEGDKFSFYTLNNSFAWVFVVFKGFYIFEYRICLP